MCESKIYEKVYGMYLTELFPVIRNLEVSEGNLTDLFVHIKYADFFNYNPESFISSLVWGMKQMNYYIGKPNPSMTIRIDKGNEFMAGTFIEARD